MPLRYVMVVFCWLPAAFALAGGQIPSLPPSLPPAIEGREIITLRGADLPEFSHTPIKTLRLFSFDGHLRPIPFQIDAMDSRDRYLLPEGTEAQATPPLLTDHDELVFLARDLGKRALPDAEFPCASTRTVALPIGRETSSRPLGWVYLAACSPETAASPTDDAKYSPDSDVIATADYELGFDPTIPALPDLLRFLPEVGGSGQNLLHGVYVAGEARLLGGLVHLVRTTRDFRSRRIAWKDGAVRVIRRSSLLVRTLGDHYTNPDTFTVQCVCSPGVVSFEVTMELNTELGSFLSDLLLAVAWDFKQFEGMQLRFPVTPTVFTVDGRPDPSERALLERDSPWIYATGPQGTYVGKLTYRARVPLLKQLYIREGEGGRLKLGYKLSNLHRVARGRSVYRADIVNLPGASYETATRVLSIRSKPLIRLDAPQRTAPR